MMCTVCVSSFVDQKASVNCALVNIISAFCEYVFFFVNICWITPT